MGSRVQPGKAQPERVNLQFVRCEESPVDIGDFVFAAGGRLDVPCYIYHLVGVEVQADYGIVALRLRRFLLYAEAVALFVEFCDAVALRVVDPVAEDRGFAFLLGASDRFLEQPGKTSSVEDVVSQDEADAVVSDEVSANGEGLCKAVRGGLLCVLEVHSVVRPVPEKPFEARQVERGGDDKDIPYPCLHQN